MTEPAARAHVDGRHNIVVQAIGSGINVAVDSRIPHLRLTHFEARTKRAHGDGADAALLSAYRTDVAPLLGRDSAVQDLQHWIARDRDVSVRVLTGGAGRGKTRLALEIVRKASQDGWLAGFVEQGELDRFRTQQNVAEWAWDKPTLIVVDYAASRADQLRDWIGELVDASIESARPPLRMLLLERQAQRAIGWLASVFGHDHDDRSRAAISLLDPPEPVELAAIDDIASRRQIFATLLARKRADLTAPALGADAEFDRLLRHERWSGDPLFLMMAGLIAGTDGVKNALALTRTDLATKIAQRELDRIGSIAAGAEIDANNRRHPGLLARHMAVLATLCQGLTLGDARALIEEESQRLGSSADINATMAALRDGLPGAEDGPQIAPILPDIVGEAAIICWLGNGGELPGLGIDTTASIHRAANTALGRTSQVLVRTAQDFAATGRDEPVRWLYAIAQAMEADLGALVVIANALPHQTMALRELALDLTRSIVDRLRIVAIDGEAGDAAQPWRLSGWLSNLGLRLGDLGRREEALAASQEAVEIRRRLAQARPDAFLPDLATSLNNLGNHLSNLGLSEEALAASREAVDIYRRLAQSGPNTFPPALATSLNNLGGDLSNLGLHEEALAASQEAVDIYRRLAQSCPDAFLPGLATSLKNLGSRLANLGRREEAPAASQEAVDIYRRLAQTRPDAFLPDLANSLNNLGIRLSNLGRREEALAASQQAVDIRRRLAQSRPDAFLPDLARTLNNLGIRLSNLGRREEALAASQEAVAIYRRLAQSRPDAFLPDLATSLNNTGAMHSNIGRREEALAASQEAVDIKRRLAQSRPDAFLPDLATSISVMSDVFAALDRHGEAAQAATQALEILAPFVERYPQTYRDLARTIAANVLRYSEAAGQRLDGALLARVARALGYGQVVEEDFRH